MTITKTVHPPSGATAMIAATQTDITALGWYYIPVVMLSAALAIAVGLVTNNIQRRYPIFWLTASKLPPHSPPAMVRDGNTTGDRGQPESEVKHKLGPIARHVLVSSSEIVIPDSLYLADEHRQVLSEIQTLLGESEYTQGMVDTGKMV